jgi:hypothetical protein
VEPFIVIPWVEMMSVVVPAVVLKVVSAVILEDAPEASETSSKHITE